MTPDGGLLWLPTGEHPAADLRTDPRAKDVRLGAASRELLAISGGPAMTWRARSDDGELEVALDVDVRSVTRPARLHPAPRGVRDGETVGTTRGWVGGLAEHFDAGVWAAQLPR